MNKNERNPKHADMVLSRVKVHQIAPGITELKTLAETEKEFINWAQKLLDIPEIWG